MAENPSVLIVSLSKHFGGAEVRVINTAEHLHCRRCCYGVVTLKDTPLESKLRERNLNTFALSMSKANPFIIFSIYKIIKRGCFNVVDAHNPQSQLWGLIAAVLAHTPLKICTVHSSYGDTERGIKKLLYELILKLNVFLGVTLISVSESVSTYLRGFGAGKVVLIHNGIAMPEVDRKETLRERERASLGLKKDDFVIITVGRLEPVKGHIYLVEALNIMLKGAFEVKCLIVGDGREFQTLNEVIISQGIENDVKLLGFHSCVTNLLAAADVFCMPSLSEGLPYALLEACACQLPVVASNVGGIAYFLRHGKTAILIEPKSSKAIVEAIRYIKDNPDVTQAITKEAFALVKNEFSIETMHRLMLEVYGLGG
ncbi:MAG: glycosyltransferase [Nitrospirae bacterium YQR-1]